MAGRRQPPRRRTRSAGRAPGAGPDAGAGTGFARAQESELAPERMVYGRHPVREAIAGPRRVHVVHATEAAARDLADDLRHVEVRATQPGVLDQLAGTRDHQGVVAEVESFGYCHIDDLFDGEARDAEERDAESPRIPPLVLCLDQVTDPHNVGAIARVCDASGASGLVLPEHRSAHVTAAVCKASAGAIEHVRVAMVTNLADSIARSKGPMLWAYGASEHGSRAYTDADFTDGVLLVLGSEGAGLRPRVRQQCDELLQVPMRGRVSSLNVSTVAALFAFEVVRQRHRAAR